LYNRNSEQDILPPNIDEKLFRLLIESVKDYAIFMIDPNGYVMSWNKGAENIHGYREDEAIGEHFSIFYTGEDNKKNEARNNLNAALKNSSHENEGWRRRKDGSVFWASVSFTTIYDDKEHLVGFAKVTRDITDRKQADDHKARVNLELENRVRENTKRIVSNEKRFRKLIENSYDGITLFDRELNIIYRSASAERITGLSAIARGEYDMMDLVHNDDKKAVDQLFKDVLSKPDIPFVIMFRLKHENGGYVWLESFFINRLNDAHIDAIVCNFRDVTERVNAEREIRKKTEQVESILESITDGFIALDNNFCYTYANQKIGEMIAHSPESLIGKCVWDVFPDAVKSETYNAFNEAMRTQQYVSHEDYFEPLDLWQENHIYPSASGLSVFVRNITEKKRAEMEREKITADLVRRNKDLEQYTYIISHNLRAPVANIKGLSDLLNCYDHTDEDCIQTLGALASSVRNLDKVIIDLNQILQTGKQVNDKNEPVSMQVVVEEIVLEHQAMIQANNVTINCDFTEVDELYTLKGYLYSIFQNLIVNSIKYRRTDADPVINITSGLKKDKVTISFSDNGKGIDIARHGQLLFGLYKRFDHTVEGKGMGLFMVKMQVESLGGSIAVDSELDKGTEFKIELLVDKAINKLPEAAFVKVAS